MSEYWKGKRVLITGERGFLGKALVKALANAGKLVIYGSSPMDLRSIEGTAMMFRAGGDEPFDVVFHLAADVGGIGDNIKRPAELLYNNILINTNVVQSARDYRAKKFIALGSSCAYPSDAPLPFTESDYLKGEPEPTNAPYAYSKRLLLTHLQAAHTQYGLNYTYLILANLYGEGCETDPEKAHVIGALVRKFVDARERDEQSVTVWGTGKARRDFLYVGDAVDVLLYLGERDALNRPINVAGREASILDLVVTIAHLVDYRGEIKWDTSKPDGSLARVLSNRELPLRSTHVSWDEFEQKLMLLITWYTRKAWYASEEHAPV